MKLTPMDINNKEFKRGLRGYNPEEVDEFLDEVIENYEQLYKDNSKLKEKITLANEQIEHYKKIESTIQNTLLLAQNAADQAKTSAEKEADMVVKNANETAQRILDKAHNDVLELNDDYEKMKQEFIKFRAKFRNFMNTQLQTFDDLEKDVLKNYNATSLAEQDENEEQLNKEEAINSEVKIELKKNNSYEEINESKEDEEIVKAKEVNLDDTADFAIDSFSKLDKKAQKDEIDEIKSFFASDDDE